jgi:hypothetical protein
MNSLSAFLATQVSIALFGVAFAFHPSVRRRSLLVRASVAFLCGAVVLTATATVLSLVGISWGERTLPIPAVLLAVVLIRRWRIADVAAAPVKWSAPAGSVIVLAVALSMSAAALVFQAWYGTMTSADFVLFWAPKAAHFASVRGLDAEFLRSPYSIHTHVNYPQLFPMTLVWSSLLTGDTMFRYGVLTAPLWMLFAFPAIVSLLREAMPDAQALVSSTVWFVAIAASLVVSLSGGNAEAPLLVYGALAVGGLLVERHGLRSRYAQFCAVAGLTGLLMTKVEGAVAFALLLCGWLLREWRIAGWKSRALRIFIPPLAVASSWWLYEIIRRTPLTDPVREGALEMSFQYIPQIVRGMLEEAAAGTFGLSWFVPLLFLMAGWRRWPRVVPALLQAVGTIAFLGFYYLHARGNPAQLIVWTMSRVSQPALSAVILAAAFVSFDRRSSPGLSEKAGVTEITDGSVPVP